MSRSDYEARQAARKERLLERADKADKRAAQAQAAADERASYIPMGQPILVGHHSERRHRRDLDRIDRDMRRAFDERGYADDLRRRADAVGQAGISSDDPTAVEQLEDKLSQLEAQREAWKRANAAWRKRRKLGDGIIAACYAIEDEQLRREAKQNIQLCPFWSAPFLLTNIGAEIRRLKARIEELRVEADAPKVDEDHGVCRLVEEPDDNRVRIYFAAKPTDDVRALLKRCGFRWSREEQAWQRQLNNAGRGAARYVIEQLTKEGN